MNTKPLLEANNLTIIRGNQIIFRHLSITLKQGQAIHLTGENGSGKTTLLQALAGTLPLNNGNIHRHSELLYLGHKAGIKSLLSVEENLNIAAQLYHHMSKAQAKEHVPHALEKTGMYALKNRQARYLSAGQQRRVQLARLWLNTPPLWLLDEPLTALDVQTIELLANRCQTHCQAGGSLLFTSHQPFPIATNTLSEVTLHQLIQTPEPYLYDEEMNHF